MSKRTFTQAKLQFPTVESKVKKTSRVPLQPVSHNTSTIPSPTPPPYPHPPTAPTAPLLPSTPDSPPPSPLSSSENHVNAASSSGVSSAIYPDQALPAQPKRSRTNAVAPKLEVPKEGDSRLLPRLNESDITDSKQLDSIIRIKQAVDIICEHCMNDSGEGRKDDMYRRLIKKLGIPRIQDMVVSSLVASTFKVLHRLIQGETPSANDVSDIPAIRPTVEFNVPGTYLHVGRISETPFARGAYLGSAVGLTPGTAEGLGGQIGVLRRVISQHCSAGYRYDQNRKRLEKGAGLVSHYNMFEPSDSSKDHVFLLVTYYTPSELEHILGYTPSSNKDVQCRHREEYTALGRITESAFIFIAGLYKGERRLYSRFANKGLYPPKHAFVLRNRSAGLESGIGGWLGGDSWEKAQQTRELGWGLELGRAAGVKGSWHEVVKHRYGIEVVNGWRSIAGLRTRNLQWAALIKCWIEGGMIQRDLRESNHPAWQFTKSSDASFVKSLPPDVLSGSQLFLQVAVRSKDDAGQKQAAKDWPRPPKGSCFWELELGVIGDDLIPTGENMSLKLWRLTNKAALATGGETAAEAVKESVNRVPVLRCAGQQVVFSEATALAWDNDPLVSTRKKKTGGKREADQVRMEWTYQLRWKVFVEWFRYAYLIVLTDDS